VITIADRVEEERREARLVRADRERMGVFLGGSRSRPDESGEGAQVEYAGVSGLEKAG